ncbi:hypothetical protein JKF63_03592 [Porcisia hertigi]|uniref:STAS domain-containing protein n=1 Tax=Porcisia hertigi TaxID=2761500 RepID=A0A836LGW2_9TRYP|nr:hypothetical protein JKF63_03592 [Porcisia hertigi]
MAPGTATALIHSGGDELTEKKNMWKKAAMKYVHRFLPISRWYGTLTQRIILNDSIAGFIVGVMLVPTCLSWSSLAGLPLSCGLIAALVASFSYGTFGQCASLSIGPVAEITTLLISIPSIPADERMDTFQSLGVQVGILSMVLSFVDCGTVIKTIFAKAVGDGYTCAAALLVISAQLNVMFNVVPEGESPWKFFNTLVALGSQGSVKSLYCFLIFMVYCMYLIQIKKTRLPLWIPHQLIVVVVSILLTWGFQLDERLNLAIVRDIPGSLSWPRLPPMDNLIGLGPYTLTITVISFVQMYVVAQRVMPDIDPNAELFAGGITNLLVNLMSGMPVSNSFSCSSVLIEQKARTPLTAYATGTVVLITILLFTRLGVFYYLPKHALAAIIVSSIWRLVDFSGPAQLWRYSRKDAGVWVLTFVLTVMGGITIGVLSGIAFSLILVVLRIARPRTVSVGFNMQTFRYGDIRKDSELLVYPNILMWRFDAPLYFINIGYFQERLKAALAAEVRPIDVVLVTCGKVVDIDAAALASMSAILSSISMSDPARPRRIILTDIHGRLEKVLLDSAALPIYVPEEYDCMSIDEITASGKFPVVFMKLNEAIAFAQRCISELYGNVETAPYPNVTFLTDVVIKAARMSTGVSRMSFLLPLLEAENVAPVAPGRTATASASLSPDATHIVVAASSEAPPEPSPVGNSRPNTARAKAFGSSEPLPHTHTTSAAAVRSTLDVDVDNGDVPQQPDDNLVSHLATLKKLSTYSPDRELVGVLGVIRHGEVTPKQKKKLLFSDPTLLRLAFRGRDLRQTKRSAGELAEFFAVVERLLWGSPASNVAARGSTDTPETSLGGAAGTSTGRVSTSMAESWWRVLSIVRSRPHGLKIQVKARVMLASGTASFAMSDWSPLAVPGHDCGSGVGAASHFASINDVANDDFGLPTAGLLVVKWGGVLTNSGILRAHVMGERLFARFYAAGDLPLRRLLQFTRHPLVTASDENRVVNTALVVTNALTQASAVKVCRSDIVLDDALTKTLGPVSRRLLREEYRYFETLLHINSAAAARHFFHIPGFRQLLRIPPLDRPFGSVGSDHRDGDDVGERNANVTTHVFSDASSSNSDNADASGLRARFPSSFRYRSKRTDTHTKGLNSQLYGAQDIPSTHGGRAFAMPPHQHRQQQPNTKGLQQEEFFTPYEVLQELEELMTVLSTLEFPAFLAKVPLSNHETLGELQQRYKAMLKNFTGDKRGIRSGHQCSESMLGSGASTKAMVAGAKSGRSANKETTSAGRDEDLGQQILLEAMEETGGSSDEDGIDVQLVEDTEDGPGSSPHRDPSGESGAWRKVRPSALTMLAANRGGADESTHGRGGHSLSSPPEPQRGAGNNSHAPQTLPDLSHRTFGPHSTSRQVHGGGSKVGGLPDAAPLFDVSDVSKLRDYGSYDVAYNLPLVLQLHDSVQEPAAVHQLRRFARALQRFSDITESMSRVGENVLEGVNSSKRFIIGSLVSDKLLRRLHTDFQELAVADEERGVHELLLKAQAQYMMEKGGVEHDVRHIIGLFSRLSCWPKKTGTRADDYGDSTWRRNEWTRETPQERDFRLRVPFISLPKQKAAVQAAADDFAGCTRLYFTTYLHVEGVLQCLFESVAVDGFSRPGKEEMEATNRLYMRHLIFKIFRRRNVSYTDAEVAAAMRRLHLLFRSDVDYEEQQRELRSGLAAIYHAMYYVSMEVYLSLGDTDGVQRNAKEELPLFRLSGTDGSDRPSATGTATGSEGGDHEEEIMESMEATGAPAVPVGGAGAAAGFFTSPSRPPIAPRTAPRHASDEPAWNSTAMKGKGAAAIAPPDGASSADAFAGFACNSLHQPRDVSLASYRDSTEASAGVESGVMTTLASPLSSLSAGVQLAVGSHAERQSHDGELVTCMSRHGTKMPSLAFSPARQREPKTPSRSTAAVPTNTKNQAKEATVLMTPAAGRRTTMVQEMKHHVSNVTPMRRIHEGLSLNDFVRLMEEVESAVRSQTEMSASVH